MIIDGRAIAEDIYTEIRSRVAALSCPPKMAIITCSPNAETRQYLSLKRAKAAAVGISFTIIELSPDITTEEVIKTIERIVADVDGVVVQLPLPATLDRERILQAIPVTHDPDAFNYEHHKSTQKPPVVVAIEEIARRYEVEFAAKKVAVVGYGRLVGKPVTHFLKQAGALVTVITEATVNQNDILKTAEIIVSGVGKPHFITADTVKDGVIIFDAGASEDGGVIVGDVHNDVVEKASIFTPVPGGIGPITVAALLRNLVNLLPQ